MAPGVAMGAGVAGPFGTIAALLIGGALFLLAWYLALHAAAWAARRITGDRSIDATDSAGCIIGVVIIVGLARIAFGR